VREGERFVLIDGYKRMRALRALKRDLVIATEWSLSEPEALLFERLLRAGDADSAIEQGWFLREMHLHFGLTQGDLARRFGRTTSWVSRRIALVELLPQSVQAHVRAGKIGAHAAMKFLVPLARANAADCARLADAAAPEAFTDREVAALCVTWSTGSAKTRELVLTAPRVVLRARDEAARLPAPPKTPLEALLDDLHAATSIARRAHGRMRDGALIAADEAERRRVRHACGDAIRGDRDRPRPLPQGDRKCSTRRPGAPSCGSMRRATARGPSPTRSSVSRGAVKAVLASGADAVPAPSFACPSSPSPTARRHHGPLRALQGQPRARPRGAHRQAARRSPTRRSPPSVGRHRHRSSRRRSPRRPLRVRARRRDAARHLAALRQDRRTGASAIESTRPLVLGYSTDDLPAVLPALHALHLQDLPDRRREVNF
jgi:ParB family chromosome partitioning protein